MWRGAEAVVRKTRFLSWEVVVKDRIPRSYRIREIDEKIRRERTRMEARLLHRAKEAGVLAPVVIKVDDTRITMTYIKGKRPEVNEDTVKAFGEILAKLHEKDIIHGDFTPANILEKDGELYVIDFGLGFFSKRIEDKADDVLAMLRAIRGYEKAFWEGYSSYKEWERVMKRVEKIQQRARYV